MFLPILGFTTEDAKSPLVTAFRCPFSLVHFEEAHDFVKEAHGSLLKTPSPSHHPTLQAAWLG